MTFLRKIEITGLFDLYDHAITLEPPLTIVAGPNGVGKTTLLSLTHALLHAKYRELTRHQFSRLTVTRGDDARLSVEPLSSDADRAEESEARLRLVLERRGEKTREEIVNLSPQDTDLQLPSYVEEIDAGTYVDYRSGETLLLEDAMRMYGRVGRMSPAENLAPQWFVPQEWRTDFVETKRLDSLLTRHRRRSPRRGQAPAAPIDFYLDAVRDEMDEARRNSFSVAQASDRTFPQRLLEKAGRLAVKEDPLRERYSVVEKLAEGLRTNGLLSDSLDALPAGKLNPTEKRIMWLFLNDFEEKMTPLRPVSDRLDQLRAVINEKFLNKELAIDPRRGVVFTAAPGNNMLEASGLSSGEQHQLALISRLLFKVAQGTTVMIDEPELSLHVTWQHQMLDDLREIAELIGLSFVLATHSTATINGRWDLVQELGPIDDTPRAL